MIQDNWTTVAHAQLEAVAQMMRGRLQAEGIEAVLRGNRAAGAAGVVNELNISWNNPLGGVEVRVRPENAERARAILAVDERSRADRARTAPTPWPVRAAGASLVAATVFYLVEALGENWGAALIGALVSFLVMMAVGTGRR